MKSGFYYLAAALMLLSVLSQTEAATTPKQEECDINELGREGAAVLVLGKRGVHIPRNEEEMIPHCAEDYRAVDAVRNYSVRCLDRFSRQVVGLLLNGAKKMIDKRCKGEGFDEFLEKHADCIRDNLDGLHTCMETLIDEMDGATKAPSSDKIPLACCRYGNYKKCSVDILKAPGTGCTEESVKYVSDMIDGYIDDAFDLVCGTYRDPTSPKCKNVKLVPKEDPNQPRSASVFVPFWKIFTSLD